MKKIQFLIALTIAITIISSLFSTKKEEEISTNKHKELITQNPSGEGVKVLGITKENEDKNIVSKTKKGSGKINFETLKLYSLINSYRKDYKLSPLQINQSLEMSAKRKIKDMIENNYFRHEDVNNVESWYLFKISGYEFKTAGENLSSGINTPWQVFNAWKNSELHNAQMLGNTFMDMGIATDCESYKISKKPSCIVVLHLGSK